MFIALRIARLVHRFAGFAAARSWRVHELLMAAGFDEAQLLLAQLPKRDLKPDSLRVKAPSSLG